MAKLVIIGGSGHVGTYLVPYLVEAGHQVTNVSRGQAEPYTPHAAWAKVRQVEIDRSEAEARGEFGSLIAGMNAEIVIDMICFTPKSAIQLAEALRGRVGHFLHTGTIWVHGYSVATPTRESDAREPFGEYGTQKSAIEDYLLGQAKRGDLPATVVRPGHIVGPGWAPLNPAGNFNPEVFRTIRRGDRLVLPNSGLETVHHVHADDVALMFTRAIENWSASVGEAFNAVSPAALSLRGYAEAMYRWHGHAPALDFLPFDAWKKAQSVEDAQATWEHISRSPCHSLEKARRRIGYAPRYTSLQAVQESVAALV